MTLQNHVLADMIREHLRGDSRLAAQCLDIEVSDRDVVLIGHVDSAELRQTAEEAVRGVLGVRHIENRILVRVRKEAEAP